MDAGFTGIKRFKALGFRLQGSGISGFGVLRIPNLGF